MTPNAGPEQEKREGERERDPLEGFEPKAEDRAREAPKPEEYFSLPIDQTISISALGAQSVASRLMGIPEEEVSKSILPLEIPAAFLQAFNHDQKVPLFKGGRSFIENIGKRALVNRIILGAYQLLNGLFCLVTRRRRASQESPPIKRREKCPECGERSVVKQGRDEEAGITYFQCTNRRCRHQFEREDESGA